jgi:hypothetical protein
MVEDSQKKSGKGRSILDQYQNLLTKYPVAVNTIQGSIIASLSVIASNTIQYIKSGEFKMNYNEMFVMAFISAVFVTPVLMWFYKNVLNKMPGGMIRKLVIDQFAFSPPFTASIITLRFFLMGLTPLENIPAEVYKVFPKAVVISWLFWIPVRFVTLKYIPPIYHLISGSLFSFVWNVVLSLILS